jgi:hypothetical protein
VEKLQARQARTPARLDAAGAAGRPWWWELEFWDYFRLMLVLGMCPCVFTVKTNFIHDN